jgi:hypothetical protein
MPLSREAREKFNVARNTVEDHIILSRTFCEILFRTRNSCSLQGIFLSNVGDNFGFNVKI